MSAALDASLDADTRFALAVAVMAAVTLSCRIGGLLIGTRLGGVPRVRQLLDVLPTCAIGAVLGPLAAAADWPQALALATTGGLYLLSGRFLLSLMAGTAILLALGATLPERAELASAFRLASLHTLDSRAVDDGDLDPLRHVRQGGNVSPPLEWHEARRVGL